MLAEISIEPALNTAEYAIMVAKDENADLFCIQNIYSKDNEEKVQS